LSELLLAAASLLLRSGDRAASPLELPNRRSRRGLARQRECPPWKCWAPQMIRTACTRLLAHAASGNGRLESIFQFRYEPEGETARVTLW